MATSQARSTRRGIWRNGAAAIFFCTLAVSLIGGGAAAEESGHPSHAADEHSAGPMDEGESYQRPEYLAAGALVRVETSARVSVGVDLGGELKHQVTIPAQEATTRTGFFVSPDVVVTSASPVRRRLGVFAVNQVFKRYLPKPLAAPFEMTHAADPAVDSRLQQCYRWLSVRSDCLVTIRPTVSVHPYSTDGHSLAVTSIRKDAQVAFLVLDCPDAAGCSPVTLPIQPAQSKGRYIAVAASGDDPLTPTVKGSLTGDHETPLSPADARVAGEKLGPTADGAPLMSAQGQVIGMVIREDDRFTGLPAQHLVDDAAKQDVTPKVGSKNHHLYQGLAFLEHGDLEGAANLLDDVATASHQTAITGLAKEARRKLEAAPQTNAQRQVPQTVASSGTQPWPWFLAFGVLVAALVAGAATWLRRGQSRTGAVTPALATSGGPADASAQGPRSPSPANPSDTSRVAAAQRSVRADAPTPAYCAKCGAQLAPGDRFCFACGAPSSTPRPS